MIQNSPSSGFKGIIESWRFDLIAAVSVALVALPLGLGIALACDMPPMAGIISAIIGGLVTTFFRSSQVAINGPSAGFIAVIIGAITLLDDGSPQTLNYVFAAIVVSGALQVIIGLLKLGRFAEQLPSSVVSGILAAIGIIIITKQATYALGIKPIGESTIEQISYVLKHLDQANLILALMTVVGLLFIAFHNKISHRLFNILPTPIWVLLMSIPFVYGFNFFESHDVHFLGQSVHVGPDFLLKIPNNIWESIILPDFSKIGTFDFWTAVITINIITSVEHLVATKAVDKIDPFRRKTNINKDLMGVGLGTVVAGMLGGLPVLTAIVRSSVNIQNGARTKGSNFFMGAIVLLVILVLEPYLQKVPLAALSTILIFTGFRLASPNVFKETYNKGLEQIIFFLGTLIMTLYKNMLWGLFGGIVLTLIVHVLIARMPIGTFFYRMLLTSFKLGKNAKDELTLYVKGIANFLNILRLQKLLDSVRPGTTMYIDLSGARLVDMTVFEILDDFRMQQAERGGNVRLIGLDEHVSVSNHKNSLSSLVKDPEERLDPREERLIKICEEYDWTYQKETNWLYSYLRNFNFFKIRPIERKYNVISGFYEGLDVAWEISDITFDEGALIARQVFDTTVQVIVLPYKIPSFILEKEGLLDKVFERFRAISGKKDIDFKEHPSFSSKFYLTGENESLVREFFTEGLIKFFEDNEIYHIESNGEALLIFRQLEQAKTEDIFKMLEFSEKLIWEIKE